MSALPRRLRIAVLHRIFSAHAGGAENYAVRIAEQLAQRHEVHVFAQEIEHAGGALHLHRIGPSVRKPRWVNQLLYAFTAARATRSGFDIVHSHENTACGDIHSIHVKSVRQGLFGQARGFRRAMRWLKVATSPRLLTYVRLEGARFRPEPGRHVVVVSDAMRDEIARAYPEAAGRLEVVMPGVDMPGVDLPVLPGDRAQARARLGLPLEATLLLFVGNDYARKGLQTLLEALEQLPAAVHVAVAGKPGQRATFQTEAQRLGVAGRVHFLGSLADLAPAYHAADVLVHPTREDSFAMVVLEAMAHGLPVVVSAAPWCGISASLRDGEEALLLPDPHDAKALAAQVERVLADPLLRERLVLAGTARAQASGWDRAAEKFEAIYLRSIAERGLASS